MTCLRIRTTLSGSVTKAMRCISLPQWGQANGNVSYIPEMRNAQSAVARTSSPGSGGGDGEVSTALASSATSMGSPARALTARRSALLHPTGTRAQGHHDSDGGAYVEAGFRQLLLRCSNS